MAILAMAKVAIFIFIPLLSRIDNHIFLKNSINQYFEYEKKDCYITIIETVNPTREPPNRYVNRDTVSIEKETSNE